MNSTKPQSDHVTQADSAAFAKPALPDTTTRHRKPTATPQHQHHSSSVPPPHSSPPPVRPRSRPGHLTVVRRATAAMPNTPEFFTDLMLANAAFESANAR